MTTSGSFNLLGNDGRCSLIGVEAGFNNLTAAGSTSTHGNESSFETVDVIRGYGAEVVALTSIVNRSGKDEINGVPVISATKINVSTWDPDDLPDNLRDIPAIKPGSRKITE